MEQQGKIKDKPGQNKQSYNRDQTSKDRTGTKQQGQVIGDKKKGLTVQGQNGDKEG